MDKEKGNRITKEAQPPTYAGKSISNDDFEDYFPCHIN